MRNKEGAIEAKALWLSGPCCPEFRPESAPAPGPGEVRVKALASGISQGTEMLVYRGHVSPDLPLDLPTFSGCFAFPIKYGYALVGQVIDKGEGVSAFSEGDTVFVRHPHQSGLTVPESMLVGLPFGLDPVLGVFLANLETAVNVMLDTPLKIGETAVVFGQGTVGALVAQLLRVAGASRVIVVDPIPLRREVAIKAGADEALEPGEDLTERVRAVTEGRGADVVIEASGSPQAMQAAIDCVADEGTVVAVSWYGTKPVTLNLGEHFHRGRVRLRSSQVSHLDPALAPRWDYERRTRVAVELLPRLCLRELITHCVPFEEAPTAYALIDEHPDETLQVVLTY